MGGRATCGAVSFTCVMARCSRPTNSCSEGVADVVCAGRHSISQSPAGAGWSAYPYETATQDTETETANCVFASATASVPTCTNMRTGANDVNPCACEPVRGTNAAQEPIGSAQPVATTMQGTETVVASCVYAVASMSATAHAQLYTSASQHACEPVSGANAAQNTAGPAHPPEAATPGAETAVLYCVIAAASTTVVSCCVVFATSDIGSRPFAPGTAYTKRSTHALVVRTYATTNCAAVDGSDGLRREDPSVAAPVGAAEHDHPTREPDHPARTRRADRRAMPATPQGAEAVSGAGVTGGTRTGTTTTSSTGTSGAGTSGAGTTTLPGTASRSTATSTSGAGTAASPLLVLGTPPAAAQPDAAPEEQEAPPSAGTTTTSRRARRQLLYR